MKLDQSQTPLLDCLLHCANRENAAFYTPGHKRGQGISERHRKVFGDRIFRTDLPELPELDNLFAPEGVIKQAQTLAADAFGAEHTWFLANGSTCGIQAAILATCGPGDKIILPRNVHSSAIAALILSGATPLYVQPTYSAEWDMPLHVEPADIEAVLQTHPDAKAVFVVSPTYQGVCSDLAAIAALTLARNIPLIVDEAHGPHFAFHPQLPPTAISSGADIAIQSAHKVLSAFTQSALMHTQGDRINKQRISQCLALTQSTSPSYLLLGSLDAARHQMATEGTKLLSETIELSNFAYAELSQITGLSVMQPSDLTRLTVDVSKLGLTGYEADEILHEKFGVTAELPALRSLTFILSVGNTESDIHKLITGFKSLLNFRRKAELIPTAPLPPATSTLLTPRQAFYAQTQTVAIENAPGRICAETICPYPPGIPTLLPGDIIAKDAIAYLKRLIAQGATLTGCQDKTLDTVMVVA